MGLDHGIDLLKKNEPGSQFKYSVVDGFSITWRNCNQFRSWFENNAENFSDNGTTIIDRDLLVDFLDVLEKVSADYSRAPELLPTEAGFFFGGLDYGEHYFSKIDTAINEVSELLNRVSEEYLTDNQYELGYWEWY